MQFQRAFEWRLHPNIVSLCNVFLWISRLVSLFLTNCVSGKDRSNVEQNKLCFAYNVRITNESVGNTVQLVSRRFEIQTIGSKNKDVVQGPGVTGRQPILKPGESFEYTSTAPLNVNLMENVPIAARMAGDYSFVVLNEDGSPLSSTPLKAKLEPFHFIVPEED